MGIQETKAKTILLKRKRIDSWFISGCGMNLYRGCSHNCVYCDGRAERYQIPGVFGQDIHVKTNAPELLEKELDPTRKRKSFNPGFILPGGGIGDSYQPLEKTYELTRHALKLLYSYNHAVHLLTKSTLILRDLDYIKKFARKNKILVSFSFSSVDKSLSDFFEPGVPDPSERINVIKQLSDEGIPCGILLMPALPYLTDTEELLEETIQRTKEAGARYIIFGGLTLKTGKQKDYFHQKLKNFNPGLIPYYERLYNPDKWGNPSIDYSTEINRRLYRIAKKYDMPIRIPASLFRHILTGNDLVSVILDQLDYLLKMSGKHSGFGYASYLISQLKIPVSDLEQNLISMKGIQQKEAMVILEILKTGTSQLYETLLKVDKKGLT